MVRFFAALMFGLLLTAGARGDENEKIPLAKVPPKALKAVKELFPKAKLEPMAEKQDDDGTIQYVISLRNGKTDYEVTVTEEGTVTEVSKDLPFNQFPKKVIAGVQMKYPKAKVTESAELSVPGETDKKYYVELTTAKGQKLEVTLDADGDVLEEEEAKSP